MKTTIEDLERLERHWQDIQTLNELGIEENDESVVEEVSEGIKKVKKDIQVLRLKTLLKGPYDKNNAIVSLHAGAGGTEAQDWVQMLLRMYTRWAENKGYTVKILDYLEGDEAGIKNVSIHVIGENA